MLNGIALCARHHNSRQFVKYGIAAHGDTGQIYELLAWLSKNRDRRFRFIIQSLGQYQKRDNKTNYEQIYKEILKWK